MDKLNTPLQIDFIPSEHRIQISDPVGRLVRNRRASFQLNRKFDVQETQSTELFIRVTESEQQQIESLLELLEFLEIPYSLSDGASSVVQSYLEEKQSFTRFAHTAGEIWAGNVEAPMLSQFTSVLTESWPRRTLYSMQLLSALHLAYSQNACNFSVPGAGKTAIVLAAYTYLNTLGPEDSKYVDRLLVVGPLSCFQPWEMEYELCFGRKADSFRISGESSTRQINELLHGLSESNYRRELILVSYQSLANHLEGIIGLLSRKSSRFMVVLDEAHRAKNTEGGLWARSTLALAPHAKSRVVLTGTPAPNGYQDLFNLFEFIWPNRQITGFGPNHLRAMTKQAFDVRRDEVADNIAPFFVRISKRDLGIPEPVDHTPQQVEMGPIQRWLYDYIEELYVGYFERETPSLSNSLVRSRLIRLMQAASNPGLLKKPIQESLDSELSDALFVDDERFFEAVYEYAEMETPAKFIALLSVLRPLLESGEKVLIWAYYIGNLLGIEEFLAENSIPSKLLYGAIPTSSDDPEVESRERIISEFHREKSDFQVLIANPYAVGESISLHKACQHAIYFERNFNAAVYLQSRDRIHRFGMVEGKTATYDYIQCTNSIEQIISRRLDEKVDLMMGAIESREIPLLNLTRESDDADQDDITAIIDDYILRKR